MDGPPQSVERTEGSAIWESRVWLLVLLGLVICQGWLVLRLFGNSDASTPPTPPSQGGEIWQALTNDQPIVSGEHGLHFYHGHLGSKAFAEEGVSSIYDVNFNAGYLKTPWFDAGSRPAELFLWLAGGGYRPAAYKIGFAITLLLIPVLIAAAAGAAGHCRSEGCLAALISMTVMWSDLGSQLIRSGDLAMLLASVGSVLAVGFFLRFHRSASFGGWLGLVVSSWFVAFIQPATLVALAPAILAGYLAVAIRHGRSWHLASWASGFVALLGNWHWLSDAIRYWWVRTDSILPFSTKSAESWRLWLLNGGAWQESGEGSLGVALVIAAAAGCLWRKGPHSRGVGWLGLAAMNAFLSLAISSGAAANGYMYAVLLIAAMPAGRSIHGVLEAAVRWRSGERRFAILSTIALCGIGYVLERPAADLAARIWNHEPVAIGLPAEAEAAVATIRSETTSAARILWEETAESDAWSALLPILTERGFVGGLGPTANIEHNAPAFRDGVLAGRPLGEWSEKELADFCKAYNIGWIVCRTTETISRLAESSLIERNIPLADGAALVSLRRKPSYFLVGHGRVVHCDNRRLTLADVTPVDGHVVLSFHYHANIRPSIDRVGVEREPDRYGNVSLLRLAVPAPLPQLTLYWNE